MWTKLKGWGAGIATIFLAVALGVGFAMRKRADNAADAIRRGREQDAEQRGQESAARARLKVIRGELDKPAAPAPKRTAAEALEEMRRRGQVKE